MQITETFHAPDRATWRDWLSRHHDSRTEIWLIGYHKSSGHPSIAYPDAVEEALCFGWIDSTRKSMDGPRFAQRYSPRRPGSAFSQTNLERLARLLRAGRVHPAVAAELGEVRPEAFAIPEYIETALQAEEGAWRHWRSFPAPYRRIRAAYVHSAREARPDEFRKRLENLVAKTAAGKKFGYGIEAFYED